MGLLLQEQGKVDLAEPYLRCALEVRERTLGRDHPHTLTSVGHLGLLLKAQGKFDLAEPYLRRALEGRERTLGSDHSDTLASVSLLRDLLMLMFEEMGGGGRH